MTRTTQAELRSSFTRYLRALHNHGGNVADFHLTHHSASGGYRVERVLVNAGNAVSLPFGYQIRPAAQMVDALRFAADSLDMTPLTRTGTPRRHPSLPFVAFPSTCELSSEERHHESVTLDELDALLRPMGDKS